MVDEQEQDCLLSLESLKMDSLECIESKEPTVAAINDTSMDDAGVWTERIVIAGISMNFKLDTGAKVNTLKVADVQYLPTTVPIRESMKTLKSYSNHLIKPIGTVQLDLVKGQRTVTADFEIINMNQDNIISGATAVDLGLITRTEPVSSISTGTSSSEQLAHPSESMDATIPPEFWEYPDLVATTRTLSGKYSVKLVEGASGVIHGARRQPVALLSRIKEKLLEMEAKGYICKVEEPTEWVSSMVVSVRGDKLRICLDVLGKRTTCRGYTPTSRHRATHRRWG